VEVAPGDSHHSPAAGLKRTVAPAVSLERGARAVRAVAIELDDQALRTPDAIGLDSETIYLHRHVEFRHRKAFAMDEADEEVL
jgi:hypothetical protein